MNAEAIFFFIFAIGAVAGALGVLFNRQPINSAISLVMSFAFLAGVYILLNAEFMAVLQVMVYAGAIMVLFIFVLMLLNQRDDEIGPAKYSVHTVIGVLVAVGLFIAMSSSVLGYAGSSQRLEAASIPTGFGTIEPIGHVLITTYVLPFELVSVLLLTGIIGAVVVAKKSS